MGKAPFVFDPRRGGGGDHIPRTDDEQCHEFLERALGAASRTQDEPLQFFIRMALQHLAERSGSKTTD